MAAISDEKQVSSSDEKQVSSSDDKQVRTSSQNTPNGVYEKDNRDVDKAYIFLTEHQSGDDSVDLKALRRKIDWRIVPIMFLCYTMQFVDKVMINCMSHLSFVMYCNTH